MISRKVAALFLITAMLGGIMPSASAMGVPAKEQAAAYLVERGILAGDENGELCLDAELTRAQLAVVLTRLHGESAQVEKNRTFFTIQCNFPDVPDWAKQYAGYCAYYGLMAGYDTGAFGADDCVTPQAACTVALRYLDLPEVTWNYSTAVKTALDLGLITPEAASEAEITRGDLAVLLYRAMEMEEAAPEEQAAGPQTGSAGSTTNPSDGVVQGTGDGYLTNGKPVTEENVLELLRQLERDWPTGTVWGTHDTPGTHKNEVPCTAARKIMHEYPVSEYYGCGGYAAMISSLVFGDASNPGRRVEDLSQIRPGDIIFRVRNDNGKVWHVLIALETPNEIHAFHVTDGNNGEAVDWPDPQSPYPHNNLDSYGEDKTYHLEAWTRYPEYVPCTGESKNIWLADIS